MTKTEATGPLIMGATGRVGQALAHLYKGGHWRPDQTPIWQYRRGSEPVAGASIRFDPLADDIPQGIAPTAIFMLAGVTHGTYDALAINTDLAIRAARLGAHFGVPALIASSQAVYGAQTEPCVETRPCTPVTPYGEAKHAMEQSVSGHARTTCLRIGNIAGVTEPFIAMRKGTITLDRFADGQSPKRAFIGPLTFAQALMQLAKARDLPPRLNLAQPGRCTMTDIADAAGIDVSHQPAPPAALPDLALDLTLMKRHLDLPQTDPRELVAEARRAGWDHA